MPDLPPPLDRAMEMVHEAWEQAYMLQTGQAMWRALAPHLNGYDTAGLLLAEWHRDWLLVGCRRLVDPVGSTSSLRQALKLVSRNAGLVTEQLMCEVGVPSWADRDAIDPAGEDFHIRLSHLRDIVHERRAELRRMVEAAGSAYEGHLTRRVVQPDIEKLEVAQDGPVVSFVNTLVAHRSATERPPPLPHDEVNTLIDLVVEVTQRWGGVLRGTHLSVRTSAPHGARAMSKALELFDWREFANAQADAEKALHKRGAPTEALKRLRENVRIRFEFGEP